VKKTIAPSVFVSHGAPMVALQENDEPFNRDIAGFFGAFPKPQAVVVLSPHWITQGRVEVTGAARLETIHDFRGFPRPLFEIQYNPPGDPALAKRVVELIAGQKLSASLNLTRGLDHGAWVPLRIAFPAADVPVIQVSLPMSGPNASADILRMGKALASLRSEGILILGSGGAVHNLRDLSWSEIRGEPYPWAKQFDDWLFERLKVADVQSLVEMEDHVENDQAHPTPEHFYPILFTLGASLPGDRLAVVHRSFQYRSLSMASYALLAGEGL
jgi:4,5-DOPA dioxygenase extradiol